MRPSLSKSGITPCPASLGWRGRNAADGPTDGAALKTSCAGNRPIIAVSGIGSRPTAVFGAVTRRQERENMTALRRLMTHAGRMGDASAGSVTVFMRDVGQGMLEV